MTQKQISSLVLSLLTVASGITARYHDEKNWKQRSVKPKYDVRTLELFAEEDEEDEVKFHCGHCSSSSSSSDCSSSSSDCDCSDLFSSSSDSDSSSCTNHHRNADERKALCDSSSDIFSSDSSDCFSSDSSDSDSSDSSDCKKEKNHCSKVIAIKKVPYTIRKSGKYCLAKNVEYHGNHAAIIVKADNVDLNLSNHSITITAPSTAILILGAEVAIHNDGLHYEPKHKGPSSAIGVHVLNTEKVTLDNVFAGGFDNGVLIENSEDVVVQNSRLVSCPGNGINASNSKAVIIRNTSLKDNGQGFLFDEGCKDSLVSQVFETNAIFGSFVRWIDGLTIEDSFFEINNSNNSFSCLQLGSTVEANAQVHDVIIRNCHFLNRQKIAANSAAAGFDGVLFAAGSNGLLEDCVIDINAPVRPAILDQGFYAYVNGALHISATLPETKAPTSSLNRIFTNLRVSNCVITNPGSNGIITENSTTNITVDSCLIGSSQIGVNLQGTSAFVLKNSEVQNNTITGVRVGDSSLLLPALGSTSNTLTGNVISKNGQLGVDLTSSSKYNLVTNNQVFSNSVHNIADSGTNNQVFNNVTFNAV